MNLLKECAGAEKIGISAHIRPDGDAIGSSMALYLYLKKAFPHTNINLLLETPPESMNHLKYLNEIDTNFNTEDNFDVYFALDCSADRLGQAEEFYRHAKKKINIDHHISNKEGCGDLNLIIPEASSTAEVLYGLLDESLIDEDIACALYTGIIHDCGVFQYSNTSQLTMEVGAKLIAYGFPFSKIIEESFYQKSYLQNILLGKVLTESKCLLGGSCIIGFISKESMESNGAKPSDLDGIVNQLRNTKGVNCAIFIYETVDGDMKVSMRSNEEVDVSSICSKFGGGGHKRAAGVTIKDTYENAVRRLTDEISLQMKEVKNV